MTAQRHHAGSVPLPRLRVPLSATLLEALRRIDVVGTGILFVTDRTGRVLGSLTDGDIRRAILSGHALDDGLRDAMNTKFTSVTPVAGRPEVLDLMRARGISQVPVLDAGRRLVGLHLLREVLGAVERPHWAVIMAGGKGVRLKPLTDTVPKPMLPVAGRPILERLVLHLVGFGIKRIFLSVNHLAHVIEDHFGDGAKFGCTIEYLRELKPLGTGGALSLLPKGARQPLLVMNGDLVTQFDVGAMLDFHQRGRYAATLGVRPYSTTVPFGVAEVRGKRLVALREKPSQRMLVNAGIYVVSPEMLSLVPRKKEFPLPELFTLGIQRGRPIGVHLIREEWTDVGQHDELRRARGES